MASGNDYVVLLGHCCFWLLVAAASVETNKRNPWQILSVSRVSRPSTGPGHSLCIYGSLRTPTESR